MSIDTGPAFISLGNTNNRWQKYGTTEKRNWNDKLSFCWDTKHEKEIKTRDELMFKSLRAVGLRKHNVSSDGLSKEEVQEAYKECWSNSLYYGRTRKNELAKKLLEDFDDFDSDKDGELNRDEFGLFVTENRKLVDEWIKIYEKTVTRPEKAFDTW